MNEIQDTDILDPWWERRVTDSLTVALLRGDGPHIRLVSTSYPIKLALADLARLRDALQEAADILAQYADIERDARESMIDLAHRPEKLVIDQNGVVLGPAGRPCEEMREQDRIPAGEIRSTGATVMEQTHAAAEEVGGLECDICGRQAIVVVNDSERTTLCDDCFDGYYRGMPHWSVAEYLERHAGGSHRPNHHET